MTRLELVTADALGNYVWADVSSGESNRASFYTAYMLPGEPVFSMDNELCGSLHKTSSGYSLHTACSCTRGKETCRCNSCDHCSACTHESMRLGEEFETDWLFKEIANNVKKGASAAVHGVGHGVAAGIRAAREHAAKNTAPKQAVETAQAAANNALQKITLINSLADKKNLDQANIDTCQATMQSVVNLLEAMLKKLDSDPADPTTTNPPQ